MRRRVCDLSCGPSRVFPIWTLERPLCSLAQGVWRPLSSSSLRRAPALACSAQTRVSAPLCGLGAEGAETQASLHGILLRHNKERIPFAATAWPVILSDPSHTEMYLWNLKNMVQRNSFTKQK